MKKYKDSIFYKIVKPIVKGLAIVLYHPKVVGLENIPKEGSVVLAGNHTKWLDPICLIAYTKRPIHFLAKKELFDNLATKYIVKAMGCIPVNRKIHDKAVLKEAYKYLENGRVVGIFPEGTINRTDDVIMPFKIGTIKACHDNNAPLVPFVITGEYKLFKNDAKIEFLKPIKVGNDLEKENQKFMDIISKKLIEGGKTHGTKRKHTSI